MTHDRSGDQIRVGHVLQHALATGGRSAAACAAAGGGGGGGGAGPPPPPRAGAAGGGAGEGAARDETTPLTALACHTLLRRAAIDVGADPEVHQLVQGGAAVGEILVEDSRV
ncbi:hypothetical protein, partial [Nocardia neocaledoniensis]|uniref:hypothetical protein n=1 Tax=Nocardia neocaledoniensis TaxID=236511 RepID=UPI002457B2FF